MKKKERGDATAAQSRAMSVSARARGQLEPSHAHYAYWRLNGEHSNGHTVDLDHDDDPTRNEQTTTCRSCREVLSEQEVYHFCIEKERKQDEEENERGRDRERRLGAANPKGVSG